MIIFSVAHTETASGARTEDGLIVEHDYSKLIVRAAVEYCKQNGVQAISISGGINAKLAAISKFKPICVVEPHLNAVANRDVRGHMVIHTKGDSEEKALAERLSDSLDQAYALLGYRPRRFGAVEVPGKYVYRPDLPLVTNKGFICNIVECAFVTNQADVEMLKKSESPQALGVALGEGVLAWLAFRKDDRND